MIDLPVPRAIMGDMREFIEGGVIGNIVRRRMFVFEYE